MNPTWQRTEENFSNQFHSSCLRPYKDYWRWYNMWSPWVQTPSRGSCILFHRGFHVRRHCRHQVDSCEQGIVTMRLLNPTRWRIEENFSNQFFKSCLRPHKDFEGGIPCDPLECEHLVGGSCKHFYRGFPCKKALSTSSWCKV